MKLWNYIVLMTGISMFFALAGLQIAGMSELFNAIGLTTSSSGIESFEVQSTLWNRIFGTAGLLSAIGLTSAVGVGLYLYTKDKSYVILPIITGVFFYWGSVMVSLVQQKGDYGVFGIALAVMFVPLTIGFIVSCVDYFMGVD
jgi:membrane protein insertase Oxa1/YidC/SpoIIIJ